jgi:hypothetical protein
MTGEYTAIPLDEHSRAQPLSAFRRYGKIAILVSAAVVTVVGPFIFGFIVGRSPTVDHRSSSTFFPEGVDTYFTSLRRFEDEY